jgi:hypothetical protein
MNTYVSFMRVLYAISCPDPILTRYATIAKHIQDCEFGILEFR